MVRTELPIQNPTTLSPALVTFIAAFIDGHMFPNNGRRHLRVKNSTAGPLTVNVRVGSTTDGIPNTSVKALSIPATSTDYTTGVFTQGYNQPDGQVWIDYPVQAGLSIAVVET